MVVDLFGHPAEWDEILEIAAHHGLLVIDDSCEALGAEYKGKKLGTFGHAATFAFYPNKQMTTGEGGILVTDDASIARLARSMRNQGRSEMGAWLSHERLGYNYRIDEMSAALGSSQLRRLETFLAKRAQVAEMYTERIAGLGHVRPPLAKPHVRVSWFVYVITLAEGLTRDVVMENMGAMGIPTRGYFAPIHLQPYIRERFGDLRGQLPVTEAIAERTIALPFHNGIDEATVDYVCEGLRRATS
jgi:perosamine synthetase